MTGRVYMRVAAIVAAALVTLAIAGEAGAQTKTYYLDLVAKTPFEIRLVPGFLTILEFENAVLAVATGDPSIVELVDVSGGTILLRPKAGRGTTDIVVSVEDVTALFRAVVVSQPRTTHKYRIVTRGGDSQESSVEQPDPRKTRPPFAQTVSRTPPPTPPPQPKAAPAAGKTGEHKTGERTEWDRFVAGLSNEQKALLVRLMRSLTLADMFAFLSSLSLEQRETFLRLVRIRGLEQDTTGRAPLPPAPSRPGAAPETRPPSTQVASGPEWIDWSATVHRTPGGTVVHYVLQNNSDRMVLADAMRLRVLVGGNPVKYTITRVNPFGYPGRIGPHSHEAGTIVLHGEATGGPVTLEWHLVEVGSGATYVVTRVVQ